MFAVAFSHGGKNGTQFQPGEELYRQKDNSAGIIELLHRKPCASSPAPPVKASTDRTQTLSHVGLIVPDIMATQARFKAFGVKILKEVGAPTPPQGPIANAFNVAGLSDEEIEATQKGLEGIGFQFALIAEDPDGNLIEVLPQT